MLPAVAALGFVRIESTFNYISTANLNAFIGICDLAHGRNVC